MNNQQEVWLRGPLPGVPALLQPVAHALLQAREEINALLIDFPDEFLWERLAGLASPGFHLQHLCGVLDRLFTYAGGEPLNRQQLNALEQEGKPYSNGCNAAVLVEKFNLRVDEAINQLSKINETKLTEPRYVGRDRLPSTALGLYVHAAEHTMRHVGQLLVTVKVLTAHSLR